MIKSVFMMSSMYFFGQKKAESPMCIDAPGNPAILWNKQAKKS